MRTKRSDIDDRPRCGDHFDFDRIANATLSFSAGRSVIVRNEAGTQEDAKKLPKLLSPLTRPHRIGFRRKHGAAATLESVGTVAINWRRLGDRETAGLGLGCCTPSLTHSIYSPPLLLPSLPLLRFSCRPSLLLSSLGARLFASANRFSLSSPTLSFSSLSTLCLIKKTVRLRRGLSFTEKNIYLPILDIFGSVRVK